MKILCLILGFFIINVVLLSKVSGAAIKTEAVEYYDGKTPLEGFVAFDDSWQGQRPVVVIVHQWMGLSDYEKMRAQQLVQQGFVAFALDVYGKGVRPKNPDEAGKLSNLYKNNFKLYRQRMKAALDFIVKHKAVDPARVVYMGYCFGGMGALEAARADFPILGSVAFHGNVKSTSAREKKQVKAKLLVLHGAIDPFVPIKDVEAFMKEMNDARADYHVVLYSGAVHAFTQKEAGDDVSKGIAYNEVADRRSWIAFMNFLNEVVPLK